MLTITPTSCMYHQCSIYAIGWPAMAANCTGLTARWNHWYTAGIRQNYISPLLLVRIEHCMSSFTLSYHVKTLCSQERRIKRWPHEVSSHKPLVGQSTSSHDLHVRVIYHCSATCHSATRHSSRSIPRGASSLLLGLGLDLVRGHLRGLCGRALTRHVLRLLRRLALRRELLLAACAMFDECCNLHCRNVRHAVRTHCQSLQKHLPSRHFVR